MGYGADDFNGALRVRLFGRNNNRVPSNPIRLGIDLGLGLQVNSASISDLILLRIGILHCTRRADCNTLGEPVRCNFFDNQDQNAFIGVGEDPTGTTVNVQYEDWLQVEPGEDYYLLINNFSNSNSGFSIQFSGDVFTAILMMPWIVPLSVIFLGRRFQLVKEDMLHLMQPQPEP